MSQYYSFFDSNSFVYPLQILSFWIVFQKSRNTKFQSIYLYFVSVVGTFQFSMAIGGTGFLSPQQIRGFPQFFLFIAL
jgi:hypothetical protein